MTWDDLPDPPVEDDDYRIITCSPGDPIDCDKDDFPDVELITPQDTWRIWSTDPDNPGSIGDIGVISVTGSGMFRVRITPTTGGPLQPGARDVKGITLEPGGPHGRSSIQPSKITGDLTGELKVQQHSSTGQYGDVKLTIDGSASGAITIPQLLELTIGGDLSGDVEIGTSLTPDLTGDLSVGGDCKKDVHVEGDVTSTGSILITGGLDKRARILVDGQQDGAISIGEKTGSLTLIHLLGGMGSGATLEINATRGLFDADGDIHIGPTVTPVALPFDGCIRIYDDGAGGGGALNGDIDIFSCHDPFGEELMICIDGDINGSVNLIQTGCPGIPATWGCASPGCP